jgi:hypothetical protein
MVCRHLPALFPNANLPVPADESDSAVCCTDTRIVCKPHPEVEGEVYVAEVYVEMFEYIDGFMLFHFRCCQSNSFCLH